MSLRFGHVCKALGGGRGGDARRLLLERGGFRLKLAQESPGPLQDHGCKTIRIKLLRSRLTILIPSAIVRARWAEIHSVTGRASSPEVPRSQSISSDTDMDDIDPNDIGLKKMAALRKRARPLSPEDRFVRLGKAGVARSPGAFGCDNKLPVSSAAV